MSSGFDRIAPFYGVFESFLFGSKLQEMRCAYLDQLAERRDILLIGEGTGLFLERLLQVNPKTNVTVVEQSAEMMERSRNRVAEKDSSRVHFLKVSLQGFKPVRRFDAVCTFFFWDFSRPFFININMACCACTRATTTSIYTWNIILYSSFHNA